MRRCDIHRLPLPLRAILNEVKRTVIQQMATRTGLFGAFALCALALPIAGEAEAKTRGLIVQRLTGIDLHGLASRREYPRQQRRRGHERA